MLIQPEAKKTQVPLGVNGDVLARGCTWNMFFPRRSESDFVDAVSKYNDELKCHTQVSGIATQAH